jgi:hypothetical protein
MCQLRNERALTKPTHQLIEKLYPAIRYLRCGLLSFFRCRWLWINGSFSIHCVAALGSTAVCQDNATSKLLG